jgi:peptide/nickel transport system permease protein
MPFLPVFLWTDILIFLLLAVAIAGLFYIQTQPHLIRPCKLILQSKRGMISVMILACYVMIGLLDSLHYRPALPLEEGQKKTIQS